MRRYLFLFIPVLAFALFSEEIKEPSLDKTLAGVSRYCRKLKTAVFEFYCHESVEERVATIDGKKSRRRFLYDYQIIGRNGKLEEKRVLLERDKKPVPPLKGARLETQFYSRFTIYAPIRIFSMENRGKFQFVLKGDGKRKGFHYWIVDFSENNTQDSGLSGNAWIGKRDFSVLRIEFHPESLDGYKKLNENAKKIGSRLQLQDIHWYEVERSGLRFPSHTEFRESYQMASGSPSRTSIKNISGLKSFSSSANEKWVWHRSQTDFYYQKYRFFSVQTSVDKEEQVKE